MCRSLPWRWPVLLLLVAPTGCSSTLQLLADPPPYVTDLRAEYFSANPASPYRVNVSRGEVVPGMDMFGVLAAWGHPERRTREDPVVEEWVYMDLDQESGDILEYDLTFKGGVLNSWSSRMHRNSALAYRSDDPLINKVTPAQPPGGKLVPKN